MPWPSASPADLHKGWSPGARPGIGGRHAWQAVALHGSWVRYSASLGRADAHCRIHCDGPRECKLDRKLAKGTLGLTAAWLKCGHNMCFDEQQMMKEVLSGEDMYAERCAERQALETLAESDAQINELVELEATVRDQARDEPQSIKCPSVLRRIASEPHD